MSTVALPFEQARAARARRRRLLVLPASAVLAVLATVLTLGTGAVRVPPVEAVQALFGHGAEQHVTVIREYELPRILLAWLVGMGLAVAGAVIQGVIRNPLAAPDIIGVTQGAGLAASAALVVLPGLEIYQLPLFAALGGVLAFTLVYLISYKGGASPVRLALVGIAVAALCESAIRFLLIKEQTAIGAALVWLSGSLAGRDMDAVRQAAPWVLLLLPLAYLTVRKLDVLGLGDDLAQGLGEPVERTRRLALFLAVALASAAVATGGTIGFVGLIAPHMARRLVGARHALLLPTAAFLGALLVLVADAVGRGAFAPLEIPAGLITAVIGAPYFLYLLMRTR
jgi:iron complex transport system permease protein